MFSTISDRNLLRLNVVQLFTKATVVQNILKLFTCCYCSHIVFRIGYSALLGLSGKRSIRI